MYRKDLNIMFSPPKVKEKADAIAECARSYLEPIVRRGRGELVSELTTPFPCVTFLLMLGAPLDDLPMLIDAKNTMLAAVLDPEARGRLTDEVFPALFAYFNAQLDLRERASDPDDDVLTALNRAMFGDRRFTRDEMIRVCAFLTLAGLDTVTSTLSKILRFLAENPGHRCELAADPTLIPAAVEEFLRYFSIVTISRAVDKDVVLGDVELHPGDRIELFTPSAGRDPEAYENADSVDFHRPRVMHLAFGSGIHRCLGSHLARLELQLGLEAIVEMMPDFHLDPQRPPREHLGEVLGVDELHVIVGKP